ncbi:hypothetical protein DT019_02855 [Streptomyces sp. SDr-06]|nr:hypothetical protein DT019_02855 [Streptomyces sp. SDr-06]
MPGTAPGDLVWNTDQDVVEVPDDLGLDLMAIPDAGFVEAEAPAASGGKQDGAAAEAPAEVIEAPADDGETAAAEADAEVVEAPARTKRGRPRKTAQSENSE